MNAHIQSINFLFLRTPLDRKNKVSTAVDIAFVAVVVVDDGGVNMQNKIVQASKQANKRRGRRRVRL
jgi:hypothetical protein